MEVLPSWQFVSVLIVLTLFIMQANAFWLVPSQVVKSGSRPSLALDRADLCEPTAPAAESSPRSRTGRRRPKKKNSKEKPPQTVAVDSFARSGNLPDIHWRAIPMEHLRHHPRFQALPLPNHIKQLDALEDVRNFRQDSWQWDVLHSGRCTTSQAVAALGFLESSAGEILGVPVSWRRGGRGAYVRLQQEALRTLSDMNRVLCAGATVLAPKAEELVSSVWGSASDLHHATYHHGAPGPDRDLRKKHARKYLRQDVSPKSIRMDWGNTQEATAVLTALNYFLDQDPGFVMKEVGMCGAGLAMNQTSSLLVGATPDAVLCHSDGRIEALEVKNHCPFVFPFVKKGKSRNQYRFVLGDRPFDGNQNVFPHYIPQLMLEMLCLGPECRSAVMVRQTATKGSLLLRMHRDDEWIDEMLHFLHRFQNEFVDKECPPPKNFFLVDADTKEASRYRRFLNRTLEIRSKVEVVGHVPHERVQRDKEAPLFLDNH